MNRVLLRNDDSRGSSFFPLTRLSLLARLGNGPRSEIDKAWDEFCGIYSPVVYRMALHGGLADSDALDVVQTVMYNFARSVRSGFSLKRRFRHYLRTITNRQIWREKKGNHRQLVSIDECGAEPAVPSASEAEWERIETEERWRVCIDRLRTSGAIRVRDWAAFEALVFQGRPAKDVAERFGITPNRVHGIKHQFLKELRKIRIRLDVELKEA